MAMEVEKALNIVGNLAHTLQKTQINLKKSPKARLTQKHYVESRIKCVEDYWSEYKQAYGEIMRTVTKEQRDKIPYIVNDEYFEHEELYLSLMTDLKDLLDSQPVNVSGSLPIPSETQQTRVVLPKIQLPTYSGQYEEWLSFHDLFNTLVHKNESLSNVQKLHYLKTSLTGEAASILKHIQVTDSNYDQAWNILKARYGNKRINVDAVMKRFFSLKKMNVCNSSSIKNLLDTTFECLHQFKNMNVQTDNWDPLIIFVIVQKLDCETHKDWEDYVSSNCEEPDSLPSLDIFRKFLECRFRTLELTEPAKQKASSVHVREKSFHAATNVENSKICQMCKENHTLSHCKEFGKQSPTQRSEFIKINKLCFNCFAPGHSVRHCRIPTSCRICKRRHHSLLHENREDNTIKPITTGNTENKETKQPEVTLHTNMEKIEETEKDITMVTSHVSTKQSTSLLATAIVKVKSEDNHTTILRALIDQGSQASFISERAAQQLMAKRYPIKGTVVGVGSTREQIKQVVQINVESRCEDFNLEVRTYVMSKPLTTKIPSRTIDTSYWPHLEGLVLADPNYCQPGSIDLLLGVDVYAQIVQSQLIKGPPGSPCAHKTNLGWILFGKVEDRRQQTESVLVMHHQIMGEDLLKTLWEIEPDLRRTHTKEESQCESFYENTYRRNSNGQYVVKLPFRINEPKAADGNTRQIAMNRLITQEKKLQKEPELREEYDKVLEEYLTMGHMEEVPKDEVNNRCVYLPHHAVVRRDKETTKIRVVFDASCKGNNGISLNDELMTGPVLQEDMRSIIMRWRMHKVCFASDVIKMYRMVIMDKKDTDYHRILWRGSVRPNLEPNNQQPEVKDYRLKTVTFGTASAPYLAIKTLIKVAEDEGEPYPEAAKIIREDFYVDDLTSGCDTTEEAIRVSKQIITILKRGGFELQKWASNDTEFLKSIDAHKVTTKANLDLKLDGTIKALGLSWNLGRDEFHYQLQLEPISSDHITKRTILSDLQKLFDPLGWIAPVIVTAKILVQRLWLEGVGWDQEISNELKEQWKFIRKDLENVNKLRIRRWLNTISTEKERITLHGFCDASEKAYAAVVYCRVQTSEGDIKINLIASRTRVAPVKTITLPRLELSGATLLAKLLTKVSQAMRIPSENVFAWTDSTIVLAWLCGEPNRWKPFVANRVVEILENKSSSQWFHVQSAYNPADIASRGSSLSELQQKTLWWNGPAWLVEENIEFTRPLRSSTDLERKKPIQSYVNVTEGEEKFIKFEECDTLRGGCNFPEGWTGGWFQSGTPGLIYINSTTMQSKGECAETDANDKFLVYDRNEDCYRCLVIHEKHKYVLQYKETYCGQRDSLSTMCESITGDAALFSMFRKEPRPLPEPCPFHPAPFTFTYSRGSGDCANPPSRAESCTDDSRLLLRYMACPDVPGTESNVEELICLATWKEGSTRYLVGLISQVQRRNSISTDEDMYRCFVYKGNHADKTVTYNIAQSGDATCNGLTSPVDGSRTMKLTNIDDEHNRCHFPSWVVEHHKWFSLDHTHQYHFTTKNATLKIMNEDGSFEEKRLVCHSILEHKDNKLVKLVAHLTRGCESGHVCVRLARREGAVLELQLGAALHDAPHHACADQLYTPHVTLITTSLYPVRCPMLGRYTVLDSLADRRRRRQQLTIDESTGEEVAEKPVECVMGQYDSASIGCGASQDTIEFQSACTSTVYTCYGSWREGALGLLLAGPAHGGPAHGGPARAGPAPRARALCFLYTTYVRNDTGVPVQYLAVSAVSRACDRAVLPGVAGDKAYNLTINGTCEQSSKYNSLAQRLCPALALLAALLLLAR